MAADTGEQRDPEVSAAVRDERVPTGVEGLDEILHGGYPVGATLLIEGAPGTGKTTLAMQFLLAGQERGQRTLFVSIAQSESELRRMADSHGFDIADVNIHSPDLLDGGGSRTFSVESDEAELVSLIEQVHGKIDEVKPDLLVFDSLLELRLLAPTLTTYRRELLALRNRLRRSGTTTLLLDHLDPQGERHAEGILHGVVRLDAENPPNGIAVRRMNVLKLRASSFEEGFHDLRIFTGGMRVFPRVVPSDSVQGPINKQLSIPHEDLTKMLGGGLEFGTTTLISGQSGAGKSTLATLFALGAAEQGYKSALFLFEERPEVFRVRSEGVGFGMAECEADGRLVLKHFDPAEISPGEFSHAVINAVENDGVRLVVIDSLTGYLKALPDRRNVDTHLHTLLQYLARRGVLVIVTLAQHGLLGESAVTELDSSYLADSILLLRQYAAGSEIRRSLAVMKKRHTEHERSIRELVIRQGEVVINPIDDDEYARADRAERHSGP